MTITLLLIRHGNTFDKGDTILRVGARTDLPLSASGREQAEKLGLHLAAQKFRPDRVFTSELKRTGETAALALAAAGYTAPITPRAELNEIDYGIDDGKPEAEVIARLGTQALQNWEEHQIMPEGWHPRPAEIKKSIEQIKAVIPAQAGIHDPTRPQLTLGLQNIWLVTSNGIARFFADGCVWDCPRPDTLKLSTGAYAHLEHDGKDWHIKGWNLRP